MYASSFGVNTRGDTLHNPAPAVVGVLSPSSLDCEPKTPWSQKGFGDEAAL
jgi:hypothetical protein